MRGVQAMRMAAAVAALFSVCARLIRRNRSEETENALVAPIPLLWFLAIFFAAVGLAACAVTLLPDDTRNLFVSFVFLFFWLCGQIITIYAINERLYWDESGFRYRSGWGREQRYSFQDIRWIRVTPYANFINYTIILPDRRIGYDSRTVANWGRFIHAYSQWRHDSGLESWQAAAKKEWLARYRSHGPFRRKMDRAAGFMPVCMLTTGFSILTVIVLLIALFWSICDNGFDAAIFHDAKALLIVPYIVLLNAPLFAVAEMDRHPGLIRWFYKGPILPDPDAEKDSQTI